jgi:hypothetical protein
VTPEAVIQVASLSGEEEIFGLDGIWQRIDWQQAMAETGGNVPRVAGLPIIDVQIQRSATGERPVVVVDQQHPTGRRVRTIEGPIDQVEELVQRQANRAPGRAKASLPTMTTPDYIGEGASAARRVFRILTVIGDLPSDSLNAMAKAIDTRN